MAALLPEGKQSFQNSAGAPLIGGRLYTYDAGTNTPRTTYQDAAGTVPNTNPVILDARGEATVFWSGSYKVVLRDASDVVIWTVDNITSPDIGVATLQNNLAASSGANLIGFLQAGAGAVSRTAQSKMRESVSVLDFGADPTGAADSTAAINLAITASNNVYIPAGVYLVNTNTGILLRTGLVLRGAGKNKTILTAVSGVGGTLAELAAYTKGSIIKRAFNPAGTNAYVNDIYISDIGVVLNHPLASVTTSAIQIGIDLRNVTGSTIERCHVGNIPPVGGPITKGGTKPFLVQGYGVAMGNVSGADPAYAGGEKNRLLNSTVYGAYKCVIQDDVTLSPNSASYAAIVKGNDIQTGHWLIGQMGQYGAGNVHIDNVLQDISKQSGDVSSSYLQYYEGYNNVVRPAYVESGSNIDFQLYLAPLANNNRIDMLMAGFTSGAGAITDASNANSYNQINYYGTNGTSELIELYNKAPRRQWVKFNWNGSAIVISGQSGGITVNRTGVGDYTITWGTLFPSTNYNISAIMDPNVSGNMSSVVVGSHSTSNLRIYTQIQDNTPANPPASIDPRNVWVGANQ